MEIITVEAAIASFATRQKGIVTAAQLLAAGFSRSQIKRRVRVGSLRPIHRNVYLAGHAAAPEGAVELGATLACGADSLISHRSAARLWKFSSFATWRGWVEISVPGRNVGRKAGLCVYRIASINPRDVRRIDGIRVTSPAHTLLGLASVLPFGDVEPAVAEALARGLVTERELEQVLDRNRGRRGVKALRQLVQLARSDGLTRSEAERKLRALLRKAGLPTPKSNVLLHGHWVDFVWPHARLVVEVDGYAFHSDKESFENDRGRDALLHARGYAVTRITWQQLVARPEEVIALIAGAAAVGSVRLPGRQR